MSKNNKVVLAFSGGLDTSYCVKYLIHEKNLEVYSVLINTGGFSADETREIEEKAYSLGVKQHLTLELEDEFYQRAIRYLVFGNVLKNNTYPLSVSAERIFQAKAVASVANDLDAAYVAHGSTGAGNDQVRFDLIFQILAPQAEILTPIRDQKLSRQEEIEFLKTHGVEVNWEKAKYSINKGLWGTSVGGAETLTSNLELPSEAYPSQLTKTSPEKLVLSFKQGELCGVNNEALAPIEAIRRIHDLATPFAIGRDIHVGDTIIGIKGRVGFEAAAPLLIIKAHHLLEKHNLTKWQQHWKEQLGNWYGMMLHEGQYLDPVMRDIEKFLESTQEHVTGDVILELQPYHFKLVGITSDFDLMKSKFGEYGEMNKNWSGEDVRGFTKILSNPLKIYYAVHNISEKEAVK